MDKSNSKVNVKIISKEVVKPSISTPSHRKDFVLSYVDQMLPVIPPYITCGLLFYTTTPQTHPLDLTRLKTSLSETLSTFYPIAGRLNQSTITCDDEGIPFIVVEVDCPLSSVLNSAKKLDLIPKFLPPPESLGISNHGQGQGLNDRIVHLSIQVSTFTCGGVVIGWYDMHKVMDGISAANFFKHWAYLSSKTSHYSESTKIFNPNFDAAISLFPPSPNPNSLKLASNKHKDNHNTTSLIIESFIFNNKALNKLKSMASSELVPNPTRFQSLSGFIWEQLLIVSQMSHYNEFNDSILQLAIDMRPYTNPPLPKESIGNLVYRGVARASREAKLPTLVAEINATISKLKDEVKKNDSVEGIRTSWDKVIEALVRYEKMAYKVASWCNLGFMDLDFGFGKPNWMVPTDGIMLAPFHKNLVLLTDFVDSSGNGIEAWFFLEEKEMEILKSNSKLLEFASLA